MISIIVPVYNAGQYISKTIENVTAQTYTDWELLLVDDCSKDKSCEIIEEEIRRFEKSGYAKDKIRLLKQKENAGAANARNRGIDESRGRYIAFLDADDVWHPEKLEKELKRSAGMLSNERFLSKAPESKVLEEKEKQARYQEMMDQVTKKLEDLR